MTRRQTTLMLAAAGFLAASSMPAGAQEIHLAGGIAAPINAHLRGVPTLRDRTVFAAYPGPGMLAGARASDEPAAPAPAGSGLNDTIRGAIGCTVGGTIATAAAFAAGGENTLNIVAGGLVPSVNRAALYVGLVGVVFGSFCAIGQALTPIVTRQFVGPPGPQPEPMPPARFDTRHAAADATIPQRMAFQSGVLGAAATGAVRRIGATALASIPTDSTRAAPVRIARQP